MRVRVALGVLFSVGILVVLLSGQAASAQVKPEDSAKVRAAAEKYVKQEQQQKGGFFLRGPDGTVRDLNFDFVHKEVATTPGNPKVVCVDFVDQSKKRFDIDFYVSPNASGDYELKQVKLHKIDGVEHKQK